MPLPRWMRRPPPMDGAADLAVAVLEHLDEPVIACDSAGHVVFVNELARALQPDGSRLYHAGTDRLVGDDEMPLWRALRGARVTGVELDVEADGAPRRRVSVSGRPL